MGTRSEQTRRLPTRSPFSDSPEDAAQECSRTRDARESPHPRRTCGTLILADSTHWISADQCSSDLTHQRPGSSRRDNRNDIQSRTIPHWPSWETGPSERRTPNRVTRTTRGCARRRAASSGRGEWLRRLGSPDGRPLGGASGRNWVAPFLTCLTSRPGGGELSLLGLPQEFNGFCTTPQFPA